MKMGYCNKGKLYITVWCIKRRLEKNGVLYLGVVNTCFCQTGVCLKEG